MAKEDELARRERARFELARRQADLAELAIRAAESQRRAETYMKMREGWDREVLMKPGEVCLIAFDVGSLSQIFNRGHRIRMTVTSTGAPFYEPNPQTGAALTIDFPAQTVSATNTIFHERRHASRLIAPVVK